MKGDENVAECQMGVTGVIGRDCNRWEHRMTNREREHWMV